MAAIPSIRGLSGSCIIMDRGSMRFRCWRSIGCIRKDLYLLRVGYGGVMGPLANIDEKGFASAAFHSFPDMMRYDPYTGDYGPNFFGHAINTGTFVTHDDAMGWICFGGNVEERHGMVHTTVLDSSRDRFSWRRWGFGSRWMRGRLFLRTSIRVSRR
jgi:hypothetical protein